MSDLIRPFLGRIFVPERSTSYAGASTKREHYGVLVAVQRKLRGFDEIAPLLPEIERPRDGEVAANLAGLSREFAPEKFERETVWASVTHNERVDRGASITINRVFGTVGTTANGVFTAVAVGGTAGAAPSFGAVITKTKTDLSLGSASANVTTNEATTVGLTRASGTPGNLGSAPGALDGNQSVDIVKTFTLSGAAIIYAAGLFDSTTVAGSNLYVEDNFSSAATLANTDSFVVTWTCSQ